MDQLVNSDPDQVRLGQIERESLENLRQQMADLGYGIRAEHVGIRRLMLPQESTDKVFETMRKTRQRLAASIRSAGAAEATTIKSRAEAASRRILAFANRRAQAIRSEGDREAAQHYKAFREDESLAIFLRRIETLRRILPHNTTFVLDAGQLSLQGLLDGAESAGGEPIGGGPSTTNHQP